MKKKIVILFHILLISGFITSYAKERTARISMEELTNPKSYYYVPFPYPKNQKEVIADLKYHIRCGMESSGNPDLLFYDSSVFDKLLFFLDIAPRYKIHTIRKEKILRANCLKGYFWVIIIANPDNKTEHARVVLEDNGLFTASGIFSNWKKTKKIVTDQDILLKLSDILKTPISKNDVTSIEWVNYYPSIGNILFPAWEIAIKNGKIYYYEPIKDKFYMILKTYEWKIQFEKSLNRAYPQKYIKPGDIVSYDEVNDRIITYQEVKK